MISFHPDMYLFIVECFHAHVFHSVAMNVCTTNYIHIQQNSTYITKIIFHTHVVYFIRILHVLSVQYVLVYPYVIRYRTDADWYLAIHSPGS